MSPSVNLPVTLTANTPENVADLNANLNAIIAALNGGLDEVNVPNLAAAFTTYKVFWTGGVRVPSAQAGPNTYIFGGYPGASTPGLATVGGTASGELVQYLDPADFNANARTTKLRMRVFWVTNATAPAITFTFGLYPVATFGGAAGAIPQIATVGAVIAGSTVAVTTPAASSNAAVTGTDFNMPAAGAYVPGVALSATAAANSTEAFFVQLQYRQV